MENRMARSPLLGALCLLLVVSAGAPMAFAQPELPVGTLAYMASYDKNEWKTTPNAPFDVIAFTGGCEKGVVVFGGTESKQAAILRDLVNGQWEVVADAPFVVEGCSGDNAFGPLVFGGTGSRRVAYMRSFKDNIWKETAAAPFAVTDIAGDNSFGPIIVGGENRDKVAYMRRFSDNKWHLVADAPFQVVAVAGDNSFGIIITGGENNRKVARMRDFDDNKWDLVAEAPFAIMDISGDSEHGPVIVGGKGNRQVAFMRSYSENKWRIVADSPIPASRISGSNVSGVVLGGAGMSEIKTVVKQVYKTAVVEFAERGDLGIQDAGTIVAEWMTTSLNRTGAFEVYERLSLNTLLEEYKLGMSGLLDDETVAEIGRIRGVQAIVTGSVSKFGDIISVTAKVIDVNTAKIIKSGDIKVTNVNAISSEIDRLAWELAR